MVDIVSARSVVKRYPRGTHALKGVDVSITSGGRFALLGPNGAGKSTLVRILVGLSQRDGGSVEIAGQDPGRRPRTLQRTIGVVPQGNDLDPLITPVKMLAFQCQLFGMTRRRALYRAEELIEEFHLQRVKEQRAFELSGGTKRRLHCALALVHRPRILFLDEPTTGMDPEARSRYWELLREIHAREGTTIFLTTQYLEEADKHTDSMALLVDGRITFAGSVRDFKTRVSPDGEMSLEDSYLTWLRRYKTDAEKDTTDGTEEDA